MEALMDIKYRIRGLFIMLFITGSSLAIERDVIAGNEDPPLPASIPSDNDRNPSTPEILFKTIVVEWEAERRNCIEAVEKAKTEFEGYQAYKKLTPDIVAYSRRMLELAMSHPGDKAARDALLWIVHQPSRVAARGTFAELESRAIELLLIHHVEDPEVARIAAILDNIPTPNRDRLLESLVTKARNRETQGLARQALAQYLLCKAIMVERSRKRDTEVKEYYVSFDEHGEKKNIEVPKFYEDQYETHLRSCDPNVLRMRSEQIFEQVLAEYGEIPYVRGGAARVIDLSHKRTLAQAASIRLDEMRNLAIGKVAPEISTVDFNDKPLKLSNYRGKIVVLVFWGSWCAPCMNDVPHERNLIQKLQDKPFALLGINCDENKDEAREVIATERITWPNWYDGAPGEGPIVNLYHVRGYPSVFVLDAEGIIRHKDVAVKNVEKIVDELFKELSTKVSIPGTVH
jgi:peroxiredoxin